MTEYINIFTLIAHMHFMQIMPLK